MLWPRSLRASICQSHLPGGHQAGASTRAPWFTCLPMGVCRQAALEQLGEGTETSVPLPSPPHTGDHPRAAGLGEGARNFTVAPGPALTRPRW